MYSFKERERRREVGRKVGRQEGRKRGREGGKKAISKLQIQGKEKAPSISHPIDN